MGNKINFNQKNSQNLKKNKIKIAVIFIIAILVVYVLVKSFISAYKSLPKNVSEQSKLYFKVEEFDSLEELFNSYECKLISTDTVNNRLIIKVQFDVDLYTGTNSNENHFLNMCKVIAEFEDFKDFELIDSDKDIDIEVTCEDTKIVEFKINGDVNYYLNHDSEINSKKDSVTITNFTIQSKVLQQLINENWDETKVDWGTRESTCNGYNIYFDEGIKYKVVSKNVFNVIFTEKYLNQVAGGLTVNSTKEEVESALGKPTYQNGNLIYGYLGEDNYLFFDFLNKEISVYPKVEVSKNDEEELKNIIEQMNNTENGTVDIKAFANNLTDLWIDYDVYDFNSNYVDLKYTLRGVELKISSSSLNNGIFIYQNYSGDRDIQTYSNVYISEDDLIFQSEKERITNESLNLVEQGDYTEEELKEMGVDFSIRFQGELTSYETGYKGPTFYSRDKSYPDSELSKTLIISSFKWYDDYKIVYSVDNDGIYVYNCRTRVNQKIKDVSENIIINSAGDGKIVYNETVEIYVDIQG